MEKVSKKEVKDFYDSFLENEEADLKLKIRHYNFFRELRESGLKRNHKVLEVGCGFGTVTSLITPYVRKGKIVAVDISPNRVAVAQHQLSKYKHAEFAVTDMSDFESEDRFDYIVMPDVLEHIPVEEHDRLFATFSKFLKDDGKVFIHIPHPIGLDYMRIHNPQHLQIIDQSLYPELYVPAIAKNGFFIHSLKSYQLGQDHDDYQFIIFKKRIPYTTSSMLPVNKTRWRKLKYRLYAWFHRL